MHEFIVALLKLLEWRCSDDDDNDDDHMHIHLYIYIATKVIIMEI
jgi:hypothetical protein